MDFNLLFTKNLQQGIVRTFKHNETPSSKIIDINEAKALPLQGFIFSEDLKNDDFMVGLESELKFYPIRSNSEFGLTPEKFEKLSYDEGRVVFDKMRENWILQNNISLIEEMFKVRNHLLGLF
jgi:hypothetical protein